MTNPRSASRLGSARSSSKGRRAAERLLLFARAQLAADHAQEESHRTRQHRAGAVTRGLGTFGDGVRCLHGRPTVDLSCQQCDVELEQRSSRCGRMSSTARVSSTSAARPSRRSASRAAGGGEPLGCALGEGGVAPAELGLVVDGLLEVVADDLVAFDERVAVVVEPGGKASVQIGTDCLGERVVGRVADEHVTEAVAVLAGELGPVGADQLAAYEPGEPGRHLRLLLGRERLHGAPVEDLALDGAALEYLPLGFVELVETGCQQRLQCGRHLDPSVAGGHGQHLGDEKRVAARSACDPLPQLT